MHKLNVLFLALVAIVSPLTSHAAPMSSQEGGSQKSFAELHAAGRRHRAEFQSNLKRDQLYSTPYWFYSQYVDGKFPKPENGWQDWFQKEKKHGELFSKAYSAVKRLGGNPEKTQELLDKYGNYCLGQCLLIENEEYELAAAQHMMNLATKDAYKGI